MKSFKRLGIDPLAVYGTVFVKCPVADTDLSAPECRARVLDELAMVQPRIVVVMGEEALRGAERARRAARRRGRSRPRARSRSSRPSCDALYVPDIDASLDDEQRQARVLEGLPLARRVVLGLPAVLVNRSVESKLLGDTTGGGLMAERAHVLVVANRTAESDELLAALKERAQQAPTRFTLLVPATPHGVAWAADMHSGGDEAEAHMEKAVGTPAGTPGLEVTGRAGRSRPGRRGAGRGEHRRRVRRRGGVDPARPTSRSWLKLDLPHRVERATGLHVEHVEASEG